MYTVGYPLLHFFVMLERWRATTVAHKYEREGRKLGILMVMGTVSFPHQFILEVSIVNFF